MAEKRFRIKERLTGHSWVALTAIAGVFALLWIIWMWFFPTTKDFLDYFFPVSIKVIVNSGTGQPFPLGLAIPTGSPGKGNSKMSLVSFVLVNSSNRQHESKYEFRVDQLPTPIYALEILTYSTYRSTVQSCSGETVDSKLFKGKDSFCIQFTYFPEGGIAQILLLFEQKSRPSVNMNRIFVGPINNTHTMQPIKIDDLLIEHRKLRLKVRFFIYFLLILACVKLYFMLREPIWRWWNGS